MAWVIGIGIYVFLLIIRPKITLIISGALIAIAGIWAALDQLDSYLTAKKRESVIVDVTYAPNKCTAEHPLLINVKNNSGSRVNSISFYVEGRRKGHSYTIYTSGYPGYKSDVIMETGWATSTCWSAPDLKWGTPENYKELYPLKETVWSTSDIYPMFSD